MESKDNEQIKLGVQDWQLNNTVLGVFGVLAPVACLAFVLGQSGAFVDFVLNTDHSKPKVPPYYFHRWLATLVFWPFRRKSNFSKAQHKKSDSRNPKHVWQDGSLLCTVVNMAVPGACKDTRDHWMQRPTHGMKLMMDYFDIQPIFTEEELTQDHLSLQQEKKFSKYLHEIHKLISKHLENYENMQFSTDYVARGMGLVIGEQNRKSTFYIYPIPKHNYQPCDLEVKIKGPCGNSGHITIPSILHYQQKWQQPTDYKRAMYMSSKLNSISPTTQGTSFLRRLSLVTQSHPDPNSEIDIRVKISPTRAKVTYVPQKTGVYEIRLVTKDCHVVGSPYSVPIELPSSSTYLSNSSNESDEENEGKYIKKKKRIISRIVDFIDEKMLLQSDGTLVKINDDNTTSENNLKCNNDNESDRNVQNVTNKLLESNISDKTQQTNIMLLPTVDIVEISSNLEQSNQIANEINLPESTTQMIENIDDIFEEIYQETLNEFSDDSTLETDFLDTLEENNNISKSLNVNLNLDDTIEELLNSSAPDILETSRKEKSPPFLENGEKISNITKSYSVGPTLFTKVPDPADLPSSKNRKTFSKKDPSKELPFPEISNSTNTSIVNNLVKVFDGKQYSSNNNEDDEDIFKETSSENGPDLVKCHMKKIPLTPEGSKYSFKIEHKNLLHKKLKSIGAITEDYDEHQCYLKDCLKQNFEQYVCQKRLTEEEQETDDNLNQNLDITAPGIVDKQKQFWNQKLNHSKATNSDELTKQKIVLKTNFVIQTYDTTNEPNKLQNLKPLEGIVGNTIKIFESKSISSTAIPTPKVRPKKIELQKSKSESFLQVPNNNNMHQIQKTVSNEDIIKIPTVEERKNKLFQAYQQSQLKNEAVKENKEEINQESIEIIFPTEVPQKTNSKPIKKHSFRRMARFKRAKLFFHHLEGSDPKINLEEPPKISRSESDFCVSYHTTDPVKSSKISDRFQVDDLFQDILGDDKLFIGIPNKMAVVASLASLDSDSSRAKYDSAYDGEPDLDNFARRPRNILKKNNNIPGFHGEYPHLPTTNTWRYKSRNETKDELITGRVLLTRSETE